VWLKVSNTPEKDFPMSMPKPSGMPAPKPSGMPVPKKSVVDIDMTPQGIVGWWPEHWQKRKLKEGVTQPEIKAYKQTQGPYFIATMVYNRARLTTYERQTEAEAVEFSLQFYMNETAQGQKDSVAA
jgi:hypothetical protein